MRPIPGHRGYYATDDGKIISMRRGKPRELPGYINIDGYLTVTVRADDGIKRKSLVHRLIISAYKGEPPFNDAIVRHLNGNPLDNRPDNLEYGTAFDNYMDAVKHGTRAAGGNELCPKITPPDIVKAIRIESARGASDGELASRFGISKTQVYRIRTGRRWANIV